MIEVGLRRSWRAKRDFIERTSVRSSEGSGMSALITSNELHVRFASLLARCLVNERYRVIVDTDQILTNISSVTLFTSLNSNGIVTGPG